jgi:peptide/nickel transport system substrate-binding protein
MSENSGYWSRFARARLSRRRWMARAATLTAGTLAWSACGDSGGTPEDAPPRRGGTLRIGTNTPFTGLDPQTEAGTGLSIAARLYGYLLHVDPRDEGVLYDQAERLEQPDRTTYIFTLRPGLRLHDVEPVRGRELTAEDVVLSIERFRANPIATTKTFHTSVLDRVEIADADRSVRVTTNRPYVYTLAYLGDIAAGAILPSEVVTDDISLYTTGLGTGPFRLETASPPGYARLVRHDGYYRAPVPYTDAMEWRLFDDERTQFEAMLRGEVEMVTAGAHAIAQSAAEEDNGVEISAEPSLSSLSVALRVDRPPFSDPRVRQALDLALDRDAMIQGISTGDGRLAGPVNSALGDAYWALDDGELREASGGDRPSQERRDAARYLLATAGVLEMPFALQIADTSTQRDVASVIKEQIEAAGWSVRVEPVDLLSWFTNLRRGSFEATLVNHLPYETPDIPLRFYHSLGPDASGNPLGYSDPAVDQLIERSWAETDRESRRTLVLDAQRRGLEARPMLHLFSGMGYSAARNIVRNRRSGLIGSLAQYNYELWLAE